jgi:hypothetical protein
VASQAIVARHFPTRSEEIGWSDIGPLAVGASLVALGWPTVTKVLMAIVPQDVIKITD